MENAARWEGNKRTRGGNYEPLRIKRSRQVVSMLGRLGIISNSSRKDNLKLRDGGGDGGTVMGQGPARTRASRGGVGYHGECRCQRKTVQQHRRGRQVRGSGYGWRHKGKYAVNFLEVSGGKGEKVATGAGEITESK